MTQKHTWTLQDLGAHNPTYPDWRSYAIRDSKTNVCLAIVGQVDRYFACEKFAEGKYGEYAQLMQAAPELLEACRAALRYGDFSSSPEVKDMLRDAIALTKGGAR